MNLTLAIYECLQKHKPNYKGIPIDVAVMPCTCGAMVAIEGNEFPGDAHKRHLATVLAAAVNPWAVLISPQYRRNQ